MKKTLKLYLIKLGFILFPVLIVVFLLCPICKVSLSSQSTELDLGFIQTDATDGSSAITFNGLDLISGMFITSSYDGANSTLEQLAKLKKLTSSEIEGKENITTVGAFAFITIIFSIALIFLIDFGFSEYAKEKGGIFLGRLQTAEIIIGGICAVFATLFVSFIPQMLNFVVQNNLIKVSLSSHIMPCAIILCVLAWGYLITRTILYFTKIFYSQKLVFSEE